MRNGTLFRFAAAVALTSTALSPISVGAAESPRSFASTVSASVDLTGPVYLDDDNKPKKKGGKNTGKIIACGAMILLGALIGGKKGLAIGVGACAVTWAIAGLTKKDNDALTDKGQELFEEDSAGPQRTKWRAPESGTELDIVTSEATMQTAKVEFEVDDGVAAPEQGMRLTSEPYVVVVDRLNFRSQPSAASDGTIRGYFERGEIVQVIGVSANGQWAAVGDRGVIVGYAALVAGGQDALVTVDRANQLRRAPPPAPVRKKGIKPRPAPAPSRILVNKTTPRAVPRLVATGGTATLRNADLQTVKTKKVDGIQTRCKNQLVSSGSRSVSKTGCQRANGSFSYT